MKNINPDVIGKLEERIESLKSELGELEVSLKEKEAVGSNELLNQTVIDNIEENIVGIKREVLPSVLAELGKNSSILAMVSAKREEIKIENGISHAKSQIKSLLDLKVKEADILSIKYPDKHRKMLEEKASITEKFENTMKNVKMQSNVQIENMGIEFANLEAENIIRIEEKAELVDKLRRHTRPTELKARGTKIELFKSKVDLIQAAVKADEYEKDRLNEKIEYLTNSLEQQSPNNDYISVSLRESLKNNAAELESNKNKIHDKKEEKRNFTYEFKKNIENIKFNSETALVTTNNAESIFTKIMNKISPKRRREEDFKKFDLTKVLNDIENSSNMNFSKYIAEEINQNEKNDFTSVLQNHVVNKSEKTLRHRLSEKVQETLNKGSDISKNAAELLKEWDETFIGKDENISFETTRAYKTNESKEDFVK